MMYTLEGRSLLEFKTLYSIVYIRECEFEECDIAVLSDYNGRKPVMYLYLHQARVAPSSLESHCSR